MTSAPPSSDLLGPWREAGIHLRCLNLSSSDLDSDWPILSPQERQKALRFRFELHRGRFIAARAELRRILAHSLDRDPAQLTFTYGPRGKPSLSTPGLPDTLSFNLSHSGDTALIATGPPGHLGVDIESPRSNRPSLDPIALADRFFTPAEAVNVKAHPRPREAFFQCWVRKEAWMKAAGAGLADGLDHFDVSSTLGTSLATLPPTPFHDPSAKWRLYAFNVSDDLPAALVFGLPLKELKSS